MLKQDKHGWHN